MTAPAEQQPAVDEAAELEAAVGQAIEACGGDPVAAVRALIVANSMLEQELAEVYAKASTGYLRGRRVTARKDSAPATGGGAEPIPGSRPRDPE
ncbi:hypothetical protein ABIB75_001094 [Bradyrhizobium sp. GM2.2]|uniref:hypothetical protein n=1 Tax=unclassified Bradyrhizobium TaxID=2631580 RepID=UPI001FF7AC25|nr:MULTISPECIES: hypothetical protein [unclassified Bradyrhizobium]MCK1540329.1 hypothetical protein [Bradyrhizobium sp. 176]MCK1556171.1 hypothetical protein [Bradyrhizobium sp. 171]